MWKLLLFFTILHLSHCSCPAGFELVRNGECREKYTTMNLKWNEAANKTVSKCAEIQAKPPIIHDAEDQAYWSSLADPDLKSFLVIGLMCNTNSKKWEWSDGSPLDYRPPPGLYVDGLDQDCTVGCTWDVHNDGKWAFACTTVLVDFTMYCTTQLPPLPVPNGDGCNSFEDDSEDGECYQVETLAETWNDAQVECRKFGADLASIHSLKENSFVRRLAVSKGAVDGLFIGATMSGKGSDFGWVDGSEWDFHYFYPGFPLDGQGDCVAMDTLASSGQWVNKNCSALLQYACVRKQNSTQPFCPQPESWKEGQLIYSPGYPFDASTPCEFILTVAAGKRVALEIILLEANSCCDHLILTDDFVGGKIIANLTGEINKKTYTTTSSNLMRVSWQPNGGVNVRGMLMSFRAF